MKIFLSGMMGTGKSTVARELAQLLGYRLHDLDAMIEAQSGTPVADIFKRDGEQAFRKLEEEVCKGLLDEPDGAVISLGGGTVINPELRRTLLLSGALFTLSARVDELSRRLKGQSHRPLLLHGNIDERLDALVRERADAYAEAHAVIPTDGREPLDIAKDIAERMHELPLVMPLGKRSYPIFIGSGIRKMLAPWLKQIAPTRAVFVTDDIIEPLWAHPIVEDIRQAGLAASTVTLLHGEANKTQKSVAEIWDASLLVRIDRRSVLVAIGGGVVGDLTGFAAATLLRGIAFVQLPTTLLAMVDSSVGGKTGFDHAQGKNLIGAFHQPRAVFCDTDFLTTLPWPERRAGYAEVIKAAFLDSESSLSFLEKRVSELRDGDVCYTKEAIRIAIALKLRVVSEDEHELTGLRASLNLGHTLGHAIEAASDYQGMRHGDAVALGMVGAVALGLALEKTSEYQAKRLAALLDGFELPTNLEAHISQPLERFLASDKKKESNRIRFVVPVAPGRVEIVPLAIENVIPLVKKGLKHLRS